MANTKLILKNTSIVDLELSEGFTIPASGQITIDPSLRHRFWDDIDVVGTLAIMIRTGVVIVNDGVTDITLANGLDVERGIDYLKFPDTAFNIRFKSNPERNNGFTSKNAQEAIEEVRSSFLGKGFQTTFMGNGTVGNEWLKSEDQNINSDQSPDIFKFGARCVGIDFTNSRGGSDFVAILCLSNINNGATVTRFFKWTVTNGRVGLKTNNINGFTVNAGDKMAVYVRDTGRNPRDLVVTLDFIVTSAPNQELIENFNQDFNSNSIPINALITEIFT